MSEQTPVQIYHSEMKKRRYRSEGFFLKTGLLAFFLLVPFIFPSFKTFDVMVKVIIFAVLASSFDILLGYSGIISFCHSMFFGIGAYSVALLVGPHGGPSYINLMTGFAVTVMLAAAMAFLISLFSLRVKAIFFAMITLAIAEFAMIVAIKMSGLTGGEDGISFTMPGIFDVSFSLGKFLGIEITGRVMTYYFVLLVCVLLFMAMLRFVHSPLGKVLLAIRNNTQRAEALGYNPFIFQGISMLFAWTVAAVSGGLYVMWVGYVNPDSCLSTMTIMLDVLLMTIIGGIGSVYGGILGAGFLKITETFMPDLQTLGQSVFPGADFLVNVTERWRLMVGVLFILVVFFFPKGIMGSFQDYVTRRKGKILQKEQGKRRI